MLEQTNHQLFFWINASAGLSGLPLLVATVIAQELILLVPASLIALWLTGAADNRRAAVKTLVAVTVALLLNQLISLFWFHGRPFMDGLGHTYLLHAPDSSFPSDHTTIIMTVGLALYTAASDWRHWPRKAGLVFILLAPLVGWSRVFLGVHYPFDIVGGGIVALLMAALMNTATALALTDKLTAMSELLYRRLFALPIAKGWLRA